MSEIKEPTPTEHSFDLLVFKFLNHSSNSIFYGITAVGMLCAAIINTATLQQIGTLPASTVIFFAILMSTAGGLLWWQQSVNRMDYKEDLNLLLDKEKGKSSEEKAAKIMDAIRVYKTTSLEKIRTLRLGFALLSTAYIVLISLTVGTSLIDKTIPLFSVENIIFTIVGSVSILLTLIFALIVKRKYVKKLAL